MDVRPHLEDHTTRVSMPTDDERGGALPKPNPRGIYMRDGCATRHAAPRPPLFFSPEIARAGRISFRSFRLAAHALASRSLVDPPPPYRARDDGTDVWVRSRPDVRGRYYYYIHPTGVAPDPNRGRYRRHRAGVARALRHLSGTLSDAGGGRAPPASGGGFAFCPDPVASQSTRLRLGPGRRVFGIVCLGLWEGINGLIVEPTRILNESLQRHGAVKTLVGACGHQSVHGKKVCYDTHCKVENTVWIRMGILHRSIFGFHCSL